MPRRTMNFWGLVGGALLALAACGESSKPPITPSAYPPSPTQPQSEERVRPADLALQVTGNEVVITLTQTKECRAAGADWTPCGVLSLAGEPVTVLFEAEPLTAKTGSDGRITIDFKDGRHLLQLLRPKTPPSLDGSDDEDGDDEQDLRRAVRHPQIEIIADAHKDTRAQLDLSKLALFSSWKQELAERRREARAERAFEEEQRRAQQVSQRRAEQAPQRQAVVTPPNPAVCKQRGAALLTLIDKNERARKSIYGSVCFGTCLGKGEQTQHGWGSSLEGECATRCDVGGTYQRGLQQFLAELQSLQSIGCMTAEQASALRGF